MVFRLLVLLHPCVVGLNSLGIELVVLVHYGLLVQRVSLIASSFGLFGFFYQDIVGYYILISCLKLVNSVPDSSCLLDYLHLLGRVLVHNGTELHPGEFHALLLLFLLLQFNYCFLPFDLCGYLHFTMEVLILNQLLCFLLLFLLLFHLPPQLVGVELRFGGFVFFLTVFGFLVV